MQRNSLFQKFLKCRDKICKVVIDGGSVVSAIYENVVSHFHRTREPHPSPSTIAWIDDTKLKITKRSLVTLATRDYLGEVWCDVLPFRLLSQLLGHLWL